MDDGLFARGLFRAFYSTQSIPLLPADIGEVAHNTLTPRNVIARDAVRSDPRIAAAMHASVWCNEEVPFYSNAAASLAAGGVDRSIVAAFVGSPSPEYLVSRDQRGCQAWVATHRDDAFHEPVVSDVPTLILSGEYDPITPPVFGEIAASTLSNSQIFEFPATGHGVLLARHACASTMIAAFLSDPTNVDSACVGAIRPPQFQLGSAGDVQNQTIEGSASSSAGATPTSSR